MTPVGIEPIIEPDRRPEFESADDFDPDEPPDIPLTNHPLPTGGPSSSLATNHAVSTSGPPASFASLIPVVALPGAPAGYTNHRLWSLALALARDHLSALRVTMFETQSALVDWHDGELRLVAASGFVADQLRASAPHLEEALRGLLGRADLPVRYLTWADFSASDREANPKETTREDSAH